MNHNTTKNLQSHKKEPIAIIGIGCRFPGGVNSPEAFWNLLRDGVDAITEVPDDRWNVRTFYDPDREKPGKTYVRWGGFVENIDQFDAQFFQISPREAAYMDPQQRLLLEVTWSALEDAGQPPENLAGSNTGVFVGLYIHDYQHIQLDSSARNSISAQVTTGTAMSIAANRISYIFDFHGPSMALDTACSSALVAVHLACQSIWNGESTQALAGGVNAILKPDMTIGMSKASMLSPDGRCKSFDAGANGFARGEGAGIVVLKPLSEAIADGDPIYAVIRGSAVNQDGHTNGITVPNGQAQEAVLRSAYREAGVLPEQVEYVEAHGTGTAVGDPIEAKALGSVLGKNRDPEKACIIGSVKTNIGHLESAAGIAGLIKAALILKHGQIPPNLHFETPNPKITFEELRLRVPQKLEVLPKNSPGLRHVGVNSFGFGGTNAHVVLEEIKIESETRPQPQGERETVKEGEARLLPLSARSPEALKAVAQKTRDFLTAQASNPDVNLSDICYTASLRRGHHDHRLALVGDSPAALIENLEAFLAEEPRLGMSSGRFIPGKSPRLTFVFSGMGQQWWAMGRQLLSSEPRFREVIEKCDGLLRQETDWSLLSELTASEAQSRINETQIAQLAIFSVQVALAALWRSWGIEPDAIIGHSVGEVAAAQVAGALSLEDAVRVVFHRSRLQAKAAGQGKMLAVGLSSEKIADYLAGYEASVSIAAVNSPHSVTLAGDTDALEQIAQSLAQQEIFQRFLRVDVPYHSPLMEPLLPELLSSLSEIKPQTAVIPLFSTVTGQQVDGAELNAYYWGQNIRNPVLFAAAIDELRERGYELFLELGAHPVLSQSIKECFAKNGKEAIVLSSLRRKEPELTLMLGAFGKLYTLGYPVDWTRLAPERERLVQLPSYPWQRERYWQESEESLQGRLSEPNQYRRAILARQVHPLLGSRLESVHPVWDGSIELQQLPYLNDHRVQGAVVYPGAAYVEMALAVAKETWGTQPCVLEEIAFHKPLLLSEDELPTLQLLLDPREKAFEIYHRVPGADSSWVQHATGKLRSQDNGFVPQPIELDEIRRRCPSEIPQSDCYEQFQKMGLQYGPCFQGIEKLWRGSGEVLGQLRVPEAIETEIEDYQLHPAMLDACFQLLLGAVSFQGTDDGKAEGIYLPVGIERLSFYGRPGLQFWSHVSPVKPSATQIKADIQLLDEMGNVLVKIKGLCCQSLATTRELVPEPIDEHLYEYQWELLARPGQDLLFPPADYLPSPLQISESLKTEVVRLSEQLGRKHYYEKVEPKFEILCAAYVLKALQQLGWEPQLHQRVSADSLAEQLGVVSGHRRLLGRMLEILQEEGMLSQVENQWQVCQLLAVQEPQETWKAMLASFPAYQAELMLLGRCGQKLAEVLRGEVDPLQLIFSEGSLTTSEHLYQDSPSYRIYNRLVQKAIAKVLERLPEGRKLRILEIGAGTGSMTSYVLPFLPANRTEYVFTDVSQLFISSAEQKFQDYPFVRYQRLDIETTPVDQGFDPHSFDLILASDVFHATRDLRQTLENVKQVLASSGLLVILELTNAPRWFDLVFGMLKGWWLFADAPLRTSHPLLPLPKWQDLLSEVGFDEVAGLSDTDGAAESLHTVILAQNPELAQETQPFAVRKTEEQGTWLIFADSSGVGQQLAELLQEHSEIPILVSPGTGFQRLEPYHFQVCPESLSDMQQLLEVVISGQPACRGVVHLWSLDTLAPDQMTQTSLASAQPLSCLSVLYLVQALAKVDRSNPPRLWLVTRGTQTVGSSVKSMSVAQSSLWGLGRVIVNEHPNFRCTLVDLSPASFSIEIESLFQELWSDDREDEIALRAEARYVHRLVRIRAADVQASPQKNPRTVSIGLEITGPVGLDHLRLRTRTRQKPGQGEVEIQICATGLNFEDVAKTKNLPADPNLEGNLFERGFGLECAGTITSIGEGVEGLEIGDEVIAFAPHSLGSYAITDARLVVHKPQSLSFEEAATIPLAFLTADHALHYLGRLSKGDRILIHAGASSVGLAAIQIAQQVGAEIFVTADSSEKQELLQALGVKHVMDSQPEAFVDEVRERTGGRGVDLVLNSLEGEAVAKSISLLNPYGRFVEIGKQNIHHNSKLNLRPFQNNLSFFAVDVARLLAERPDWAGSQLRQVMQYFAAETLHSLPYRVFPISKVRSAFRCMAQAKQIGKIVVSLQDPDVGVASSTEETVTFPADGTHLITGGLGGFSLAVARWLVENGAKHLVLIGRSGASSPAAQKAVKALEESGANVVVARADVTQEQQVAGVLADIRQSMPPLRGIIHAAMVLDDDILLNLNEKRMQKVMAPKIVGAWNLHTQTLKESLDYFWLFSSLTSIVGNPGQGNYCAANTFLDGLAHYRRSQGLPALSINWGTIAKVGYVAQRTDVSEYLERIGVKPLLPQQALSALGKLLRKGAVQATVAAVHWQRLSKTYAAGSAPRFSYVVGEDAPDHAQMDDGEEDLRLNSILAAEPAERQRLLSECIREQVAKVLLTSASKLDIEQPLTNLGFDSLMAVELSNRIKNELGVELPTVKLIQGPSIVQVAMQVNEQLTETHSSSPKPRAPVVTSMEVPKAPNNGLSKGVQTIDSAELLTELERLSDAEVETLLNLISSEKEVA